MRNFCLIMSLLFCATIIAQEKKIYSVPEINSLSEKWSGLFTQGKIIEMFDDMKTYWIVPEAKADEMKNKTNDFVDAIRLNYGNSIDAVKIGSQNLSEVAYREVFFLRYEKSALRAIFVYYNNGSGWNLSSFEWDDKFSKEFDQE